METRKLEKIIKGVANHRRIQILELLNRKPNLSVSQISTELKANFKTISEHIRRLTQSGLLIKKNMGPAVEHTVSKLGSHILKFLRTLE